METLDDKIKMFLDISSGSGSGSGYGSGDGDGYGSGDGDGDGYGSGSGYGSGYGSGSGDNITTYNSNHVYMVDNVATIIYNIRGNIAKGAILQSDMTLKPCFIAKYGDCFAHGDTIQAAIADAHSKYMLNTPEEERIEEFVKAHPNYLELYPAIDLFNWHNILTGSCRMGRVQFCQENNIDIEKDSFTVKDFVKLTANSYGGETIKKLKDSYPTS